MADFVKVTHAATQVEAEMLSQRLAGEGIQSFSRQSVEQARPKIYSGSLSSAFGLDLYVAESDRDRARELIRKWNSAEIDEQSLANEAEEATKIPDDIREYLEEIKAESKRPLLERFYWSDLSRKMLRVLGGVVLLAFVILLVMSFMQ